MENRISARGVLGFLFKSKYAAWSLGLLLLQQVIVASSTCWLARFAAAAAAGRSIAGYGSLYGLSLLLPYLPGILSLTCVNLWVVDLHKKFIDRFIGNNRGRIRLWRNHDERALRTALLGKEAPQALLDSGNYFYELFSTSLNIAMNTAVIAVVVHPIFAASYALSLSLCAVLIWKSRGANESLALKSQDSSVRFTSVMHRMWDNVLLANSFNFSRWRENSETAFQIARRDRIRSFDFTQLMSGLTTVVAMIPIAAAVIWFLWVHPSGSPETAAMLITIPRLFMILTVTFRLLSLSFGWISHLARMRAIFDGLEIPPADAGDLRSHIDFNRLRIESGDGAEAASNLDELIPLLGKPGRYTVRGQNGAGKTALLLKLKEQEPLRATYIPASHDLDVSEYRNGQSTGQRARRVIGEIFKNDPSPIILMDEWDANLDPSNREELSDQIHRESSKRCIVEVVHTR